MRARVALQSDAQRTRGAFDLTGVLALQRLTPNTLRLRTDYGSGMSCAFHKRSGSGCDGTGSAATSRSPMRRHRRGRSAGSSPGASRVSTDSRPTPSDNPPSRPAGFLRNLRRRRPEPGLDRKTPARCPRHPIRQNAGDRQLEQRRRDLGVDRPPDQRGVIVHLTGQLAEEVVEVDDQVLRRIQWISGQLTATTQVAYGRVEGEYPVSLPRSTTSSTWRASASAAPTPPTRSTCKACAVHAIAARPNARSPRCRCCQPAARSGPTSCRSSRTQATSMAPNRVAVQSTTRRQRTRGSVDLSASRGCLPLQRRRPIRSSRLGPTTGYRIRQTIRSRIRDAS